MKVGLFIPCYIDQFYPEVGIATYKLLRGLSLTVEYPMDQICCGQPLANSGIHHHAKKYEVRYKKVFSGYDYIICPSGSCTLHVRDHFRDTGHDPEFSDIRKRTYELTEFLHDIIELKSIEARFPYKVALMKSCHGLRGLRLGLSSELHGTPFSKPESILRLVKDIEIVNFERDDECCGFGGTFSVFEEAVSVKMGKDKLNYLIKSGAEVVTGNDVSCFMHIDGLARKQGNAGLRFMHIAEILNQSL